MGVKFNKALRLENKRLPGLIAPSFIIGFLTIKNEIRSSRFKHYSKSLV